DRYGLSGFFPAGVKDLVQRSRARQPAEHREQKIAVGSGQDYRFLSRKFYDEAEHRVISRGKV
ncbi:MAG: hypothetical protein LBS52_00655, partial [Dysgonamonadaceae bacterium]|nr:hypothetical protein [Dysgonamonadaceae bacterium]